MSWFASAYAPDETAREAGWPKVVGALWRRADVLRYGENPHQVGRGARQHLRRLPRALLVGTVGRMVRDGWSVRGRKVRIGP